MKTHRRMKQSTLLFALLVLLCPSSLMAQGRGNGVANRQGRDTVHVLRAALAAYSRAKPDQRLILLQRSKLCSGIVKVHGPDLPVADAAQARVPTRVSISRIYFQGATVAQVWIDNKSQGATCFFNHRVVLGRPIGQQVWKVVLVAREEHECNP